MLEVIIVVLPKLGKDPILGNSYRPISLLTMDRKLLSKVLANRLSPLMPALIHKNQSGFIPTGATTINIRRLFINLQILMANEGDRAVLSLDAAKALDSVEGEYLWEVLRKIGVGSRFLNWIRILYRFPQARLRINDSLSKRLICIGALDRGVHYPHYCLPWR